ncbi:MAG: hypothetical protein GXY45_10595 [Ramlibacter sp.]|nr:hypothetical protein [Ramlibacter sp.]
MTRDEIRNILLAHGYTIKSGQADLMPYVYEAAEALIAAKNQALLQELNNIAAKNQALLQELNNIATTDWRSWDRESRSPATFATWAQSRARQAIAQAGGEQLC